jgi:hypothetical protein
MLTSFFYHVALVMHIIGLTVLAATTVVDYIIFKQFWKVYNDNRQNALIIRSTMTTYPRLFAIGIILLIASGVTMMGITHGAFGEQIWFRIKFGLVILIILNGLTIGRRQGMKLSNVLSGKYEGANADAILLKVRSTLSVFHLTQMLLFLIVFVLSVFKFN